MPAPNVIFGAGLGMWSRGANVPADPGTTPWPDESGNGRSWSAPSGAVRTHAGSMPVVALSSTGPQYLTADATGITGEFVWWFLAKRDGGSDFLADGVAGARFGVQAAGLGWAYYGDVGILSTNQTRYDNWNRHAIHFVPGGTSTAYLNGVAVATASTPNDSPGVLFINGAFNQTRAADLRVADYGIGATSNGPADVAAIDAWLVEEYASILTSPEEIFADLRGWDTANTINVTQGTIPVVADSGVDRAVVTSGVAPQQKFQRDLGGATGLVPYGFWAVLEHVGGNDFLIGGSPQLRRNGALWRFYNIGTVIDYGTHVFNQPIAFFYYINEEASYVHHNGVDQGVELPISLRSHSVLTANALGAGGGCSFNFADWGLAVDPTDAEVADLHRWFQREYSPITGEIQIPLNAVTRTGKRLVSGLL